MAKRSRGPSLAILRLLPTLWQLPMSRMPAEDIKTSVQDRRQHEIPEEAFRRLNGRRQPRPPAKLNNSGPSETLQPHPSRSRNALDAGTPLPKGIENARKPSASVANPYQLIKSFVSTMILTHLPSAQFTDKVPRSVAIVLDAYRLVKASGGNNTASAPSTGKTTTTRTRGKKGARAFVANVSDDLARRGASGDSLDRTA